MDTFLRNIARVYVGNYGEDISTITFVFPNRRSGVFFQKYIAEEYGKAIFSPQILTINELFFSLSPYRPADKISLLFDIYDLYRRQSGSLETFDNFVFWGEMLLNDFDDIDKYMVDAQQLFTNIKEIKEIDEIFDYLTEEQLAAIRRFWSHFIPAHDSKKKLDFIALWEMLFPLYQSIRELLHNRHTAYEGMAFREVAQRARNKEELDLPFEKIVFVGLNALTRSEEILMLRLKELGIADFYWDYNSPALLDNYNKASYFVKQNKILFPSRFDICEEITSQPEIEVIGIPSAVGQAKYLYPLLSQLIEKGDIAQPTEALNTAVVLPDERLLLPSLYAIPEKIDTINVTMGYTLSATPIAGLFDALAALQKQIRQVAGIPQFYHRNVLSLLSHRYLVNSGKEIVNNLTRQIKRNNKIFISPDELSLTPSLQCIFQPLNTAKEASPYLLRIIEEMQRNLSVPEEENEEEKSDLTVLEKEFLYHYYITIKRLQDEIESFDIEMSVSTYFKLLSKMASGIAIPFCGEPLAGLQIMGVLETRAVDFENLIILSMNEGIFPVKKVANTFIPHNLRKGFGLSTTEHQDSIYAYYFYRMIARAKKIYLLYDTRTEGMQTGEISRFVYQLKYHYNYPIVERYITSNITTEEPISIEIEKNKSILEKLEEFTSGGKKAISASAINTYLNCPLQFYFNYIEGLKKEDDVSESVEASTFGSIYHYVMEHLYERLKGNRVTADLLRKAQKENDTITHLLEEGFAKYYYKSNRPKKLAGENYLVGEIIRKYIKRTLDIDCRITPFFYVQTEWKMQKEYTLRNGKRVNLTAIIDRVDEVNNQLRIIDYKTGKAEMGFKSIDQLFDKEEKNRPKAIMQVFMYALMYYLETGISDLRPGIYGLKDIFNTEFSPDLEYKPEKKVLPVQSFASFLEEFNTAFDNCLSEIFDETIPFRQTIKPDHCTYCDFSAFCKRSND